MVHLLPWLNRASEQLPLAISLCINGGLFVSSFTDGVDVWRLNWDTLKQNPCGPRRFSYATCTQQIFAKRFIHVDVLPASWEKAVPEEIWL